MQPLFNRASIDFTCDNEIGQEGKNSKVFLATDHQFDSQIVVKRIDINRFKSVDDYFQEVRKLHQTRHSFVTPVYYGCKDNDYVYIAMPYYAEGSLKAKLQSSNLTIREILRYANHYLTGLNHIHSKGLLHLDLKPDNFLINDRNEAIVSDFGISVHMDEQGFAHPNYMYYKYFTPEELRDEQASIASDIFQIGLTLYQGVNGIEQFNAHMPGTDDAMQEAILNGSFPSRSQYQYHVPVILRQIINKCLNVDQLSRYESVLELLNSLNKIDKIIDWRFESDDSTSTWIEQTDNRKERIVVCRKKDNNMFEVTSLKRNLVSGSEQRRHKHCHSGVPGSQIRSTIQSILRDDW